MTNRYGTPTTTTNISTILIGVFCLQLSLWKHKASYPTGQTVVWGFLLRTMLGLNVSQLFVRMDAYACIFAPPTKLNKEVHCWFNKASLVHTLPTAVKCLCILCWSYCVYIMFRLTKQIFLYLATPAAQWWYSSCNADLIVGGYQPLIGVY